MKAFRLVLALLLAGSPVFAQSWERQYADKGYTVEDTMIQGRRAVFVVPQKANGRWIARPAFIGAFDLSGCRALSIIGKTGIGHHPHSLSPCDTIVSFLMKP